MLNAGVLGAGHLGKIHLKLLNQSTKYNLVGFFDSDTEASKKVEAEFGYKHFPTMEALIEACDVVDVVTPTICLLYTSPSPRDGLLSRMPSSA